ncbi:MAG: Chemotaxis response regulator protein-glutamate methylesterase [Myxococcota bacterium]|nr:Chemotaxis response regulator protein-glutamate methylesterase [Myxococcota bacterium]
MEELGRISLVKGASEGRGNGYAIPRILVVEDDKNFRSALAEQLEALGVSVATAGDGEEALSLARSGPPDLIFLDCLLPRKDGFTVASTLKKEPETADIPIIFMSAVYRDPQFMLENKKKYGAFDFYKKSQVSDELRDILKRVFKRDFSTESREESGQFVSGRFAEMLYELYERRFTGTLEVSRDEVKKSITMEEGLPVQATSNVREEYLGNLLVRFERITEEDNLRATQQAASGGGFYGRHLVEMGLLTYTSLYEGLRLQFRERISEICAWDKGTYLLTPRKSGLGAADHPLKRGGSVAVHPVELITYGIRSHATVEEMTAVFEPNSRKYIVRTDQFLRFVDFLDLKPGEWAVMRAIDGKKSISDMLRTTPQAPDIVLRLLLALYRLKMINFTDEPDPVKDARIERQYTMKALQTTDEKVQEEVLKDYLTMLNLHYYDFLGLPQNAAAADIEAAYKKAATKYNPQIYTGILSRDICEHVDELRERAEQGYRVLSDPEKRKKYDGELQRASIQEVDNSGVRAEVHFQTGERFLAAKRFAEALSEFKKAYELDTNQPEYLAFIAWAHYNNPGGDKGQKTLEARMMIEKALYMDSGMFQAHYFLGVILRVAGETRTASEHFERCLQFNPGHVEARQELRILQSRNEKEAADKGVGLLKKLLGR